MFFFSQLTYPVEQPYRIRWITEMFYAGSTILIAMLVVFNLILAGYESVTVLTDDPNITDYKQWWAPESLPTALRIRTKPGECQETKLPVNTPLQTNSTLPFFSYSLANDFVLPNAQGRQAGLKRETPYKANPLNNCRVQNMTFTAEPKLPAFKISTKVRCPPVSNPPQIREFEVSFYTTAAPIFRPDSVLDYLAFQGMHNSTDTQDYPTLNKFGPLNDTFLNILGVVDMLSSDVLEALHIRMQTWGNVDPIPELGYMSWDGQEDERALTDPRRIIGRETYANTLWYQGDYLGFMNATIINMFVSVRDAIHLDLGYANSANIYLNKSAFNKAIVPDEFIISLHPNMTQVDPNHSYEACTWAWGCILDFNPSWARALTSTDQPVNNLTLPIKPSSPIMPSVMYISYLCPIYERKSWGDLLVSVFVGTFSMYATIYGLFTWLAPEFDRKLKGPQPWETHQSWEMGQPHRHYVSIKRPLGNSSPETPASASAPWQEENDKESLLRDYVDRQA